MQPPRPQVSASNIPSVNKRARAERFFPRMMSDSRFAGPFREATAFHAAKRIYYIPENLLTPVSRRRRRGAEYTPSRGISLIHR